MLTPKLANYDDLELIGTGGFSRVYRARQRSTGRAFAVKFVAGVVGDDEGTPGRIARFRRELALCRELYHPHIVGLVDQGECEGTPYAVFEYVEGQTLAELLRARRVLSAQEAGELMAQVLDALTCAHGKGVVHRDLKPSNIMISKTGARPSAKVLDFGIGAFLPEMRRPNDITLTRTTETVGTPAYVSPEQLRGDPVTARSDLYAWGIVFLECLLGRPPLRGATVAQLFHQHLSPHEIPLPGPLQRHALGRVLRRAFRKNPAQRASSAAELLTELQKVHVADLVGDVGESTEAAPPEAEPTWIGLGGPATRRQITSLSCFVNVAPMGEQPDPEVIAALQADQLSSSAELCTEFGGEIVGVLGSQILVHFGARQSSDAAPRLAVRTALNVVGQIERRARRLEKSANLTVQVRVGLDIGIVLALQDGRVIGLTDAVASRLAETAPVGTVLASEAAQQVLGRHVQLVPAVSVVLPGAAAAQQTFAVLATHDDPTTKSFYAALDSSLVGRDAELAALLPLLESPSSPGPRALLVSGEPGIGKSRLLRELRYRASEHKWSFQECRCLPEHRNSALHPLLELLRRELGVRANSSPEHAVERLEAAAKGFSTEPELSVPILCTWLSLPVPEHYAPLQHSPGRQKSLLLGIIEEVLDRSSRRQPLVLVVEDLHWADPSSVQFLQSLIERVRSSSLLVAMSARSQFKPPFSPEVLVHVELGRLDAAFTAALMQRVTGSAALSAVAVRRVAEQTEGVPLFVEEYTRMLVDSGQLTLRDGVYELQADEAKQAVPITLRDLLTERLDRSGVARETAQLAAAVGREFDVALLAAASTRGQDQLLADLDQLVGADLLHRRRGSTLDRFAFRHALIRDAAYDSLPKDARQHAHRRIARALEELFREQARAQPAEVARHHAEGRDYARAIEHGVLAAESSLKRSANQEAIGHATAALAWVKEIASAATLESELRLEGVLCQALTGTQGWAGADVKASVDRSRSLLARATRSEHRLPTLLALATYHHTASNRTDFRQIVQELSDGAQDRRSRMLTDALHCCGLWCEGDYVRAELVATRALESYDPEVDLDSARSLGFDGRVLASATLALVRCYTRDSESAAAASAESLAWARQLDHVPSLGIALLYAAVGGVLLEQPQRTAEVTGELLVLSERYGLPAFQGYGALLHGWANGNQGQAPAILGQLGAMGCRLGLPFYTSLLAGAEAQGRGPEAAIAVLDRCLTLCEETGERSYEAELYFKRAMYELQLGVAARERAQRSLQAAVELARKCGMNVVERRAGRELAALVSPAREGEI